MRSRRPTPSLLSCLVSTLLCCLLVAAPAASALQGGNSPRGAQAKENHPTKGAPGQNLPNLDEVRRRGPANPKALPPVHSKLKKCPPDEPNCNAPAGTGSPQAAAGEGSPATEPSRAYSLFGLLAAGVSNPYAGLMLASAKPGLPEPPRADGAAVQEPTPTGWLSSLASLFGGGAAARRMPVGGFENADCFYAWGYAWDSAQPNVPVIVALYDNNQLEPIATTLADRPRQDLIQMTGDEGRHGFRFELPDSLRDGATHNLSVKIQGTGFTLSYSPKIISSCTVSYQGAITSADCDQVTGWAWDAGRPATPIDVDVFVDGVFAARASADAYNSQLNKGDNRHQFRVPTPLAARDGQPHAITIRPSGSAQSLGSPASVTCNGPNYYGVVDGADCNYVYGWAWDHRPTTPVSVDLYADGQYVTTALADTFRPDLPGAGIGDGRHGYQIAIPDALRDGATHTLTARFSGGGPPLSGSALVTCAAQTSCSPAQDVPSSEFVKGFYLGALARRPRPHELQYWNDALRAAAAQGQTPLSERAKLLGRELFRQGEYAVRDAARPPAGKEEAYVADLYWGYLQRGPDASGQGTWADGIRNTPAGQDGRLNALAAFESSPEFSARVASVCPAPAESVSSYDAVADFSPLQNPDAAWTYGYRAGAGSFTAYADRSNPWGAGVTGWSRDTNGLFAIRNVAGATYQYPVAPSVVQPADVLNLHPGPNAEKSVVRWTAAATGKYVIAGYFKGIDTQGPTTSDVSVKHNGASLFAANVNGYGVTAPFSVSRDVTAGETVEFAVGVGSNGTYNYDSTGLAVTISPQPPAQTQPYAGTAAQLPGKIEAELFDAGGEGVAYHDTSAHSQGQDYDQPPSYPAPAFRQPTDVDIYKQAAGYSNGYMVLMQAGDWMNYTVDVAQPGTYTLSAQTFYWGSTGGTFHVEVDGANVTGPLQLAGTSTWQTLSKTGVALNAGRRVLRVVCDLNGSDGVYMGDIDYLRLTPDGEAGLLGYWKFDEAAGATAADSSVGSHPGTLQAGAGWGAGASGSAAALDGADDYVQMGANGFAVSSGLTVSAWLYPTGAGSDATMGGIVVNKEGEYEITRFPNGTIQWAIANTSPGWNWVNTGYVAPLNQWTHLTFTYDGSAGKTYANGQLVHTAAATGAIGDVLPAQNDFRVGGRQGMSQNFAGRLDEVRVYNRALTQAEVGALPGVPSSGLAGHWKLDEGAGATVADSSGGGSPGALQNGAAWAAGRVGAGAMNFDGADDRVGVAASSAITSLADNFTVSFWALPRSAHQIDPEVATGIYGTSGQRYAISPVWRPTGEAGVGLSVGTNGVSVYEHTSGDMPAVLVHQGAVSGWTHVALVYEAKRPKLYLNGQLVRTGAVSGRGAIRINPYMIGGMEYGYFDGQMDDVRVYSRPLAAAEVGALAAAAGVDPTGNDFSEAKKDPANETGAGGDDPLSRNFNFSVPLVGLKGRAGLDLGLSLSYNSLVWTRDAATGAVKFDSDYGDPSPGFRLGLPVIHRKHRNGRGENAYMLVTPSGGRVELRQVGASNRYEATDASYSQLTEDTGLTLRPSDGSQVSFALKGYEYKPTQIKDRNGNFISLAYNMAGNVSSITDTLGRVITFTYDANGSPAAMEQNTNGQVHQWATFGYANLTLGTQFADPSKVTGPANGTTLSALDRVSLDDGSFYSFLYNAWGQVYRIERRAADGSATGRLLSYTEYDLQTPTAAQTANGTDCPRFTQRKDFIKDWNGDAPVVTTYSKDPAGFQVVKNNRQLDGGGQAVDTPDTVTQEIVYGPSNTWKKGRVTEVRTSWQGTLRRTAKTTWAQDDESLAYPLNPRVAIAEVSDPQGNRTGMSYAYTSFGLPVDVTEWEGPQSKALRRTHTEYNLDPAYVSRRVIGLVSSKSVYDELGHVASKVDYTYDQGGQFLQHQGQPVQHDGTNYGASFAIGRGLVTSVRRWDVTALHDVTKSVESRAGYNTTGSAIFSRDPLGHGASISYMDRFTDKAGTNTLAYPTARKDADGFTTKAEYSFATGLVTRTEDPKGAQQTLTYDAAGRPVRLERSGRDAGTNQVLSGGYERWVYSDTLDAVQSWTQIEAGKPEVGSFTMLDGAGRTRAVASDFPNSVGGYRAQYTTFDITGRVAAKSNPAEINGLWNPAGDDASGWNWTVQTYDWKGRPLVTTNPDGTSKEASYGGCGCAGGEVVTLKDEAVLVDGVMRSRGSKITHDPLGRPVKSEVLDLNGAVFATTTTKYDALGNELRVRRYAGAALSPEPAAEAEGYQTKTMTYDGHGRLKTSKSPSESAASVVSYRNNDSVESVTDARGVVNTFSYNGRGLLTGVAYGTATGVAATPNVTLVYDAAGNRIQLDDGLGVVEYTYDIFSRMQSEKRTFSDPGTNIHGAAKTISYSYTLNGRLKGVTDPSGALTQYNYDRAGQISGVTDGATRVYASDIKYRAWGIMKSMKYGNHLSVSVDFNSRMLPQQFQVSGQPSQFGPSTVMSSQYSYYPGGQIRFADDGVDDRFDRGFGYDKVGRLAETYTGTQARDFVAGTNVGTQDGPYRQSYRYDAWDNLTSREARFWSQSDTYAASFNASNRDPLKGYDAAGHITQDDDLSYTYDAAGRNSTVSNAGGTNVTTQWRDGSGQVIKRKVQKTNFPASTKVTYYMRSSVLGGSVVAELNSSGQKLKGFVLAGNEVLAEQAGTSIIKWRHSNPVTGSRGESREDGSYQKTAEPDAMGTNLGTEDPFDNVGSGSGMLEPEPMRPLIGGGGSAPGSPTCVVDGFEMDCADAARLMEMGAAELDKRYEPPSFIGAMPIWGRACTGELGGEMQCEDYISGYSSILDVNSLGQLTPPQYLEIATTGKLPGSGLGPYTPQQIKDAVGVCSESMFGVKLLDFQQSGKGQNGTFTGEIIEGSYTGQREMLGPLTGSPSTQLQTVGPQIFIVNDVKRFDTKELKAKFGKGQKATVAGVAIPYNDWKGSEFQATGYSPYRNYTASNLGNGNDPALPGVSRTVATQIHELGNSLSMITGINIGDVRRPHDDDAGQAFEMCVKDVLGRTAGPR